MLVLPMVVAKTVALMMGLQESAVMTVLCLE